MDTDTVGADSGSYNTESNDLSNMPTDNPGEIGKNNMPIDPEDLPTEE